MNEGKKVFVTGGTGLLGVQLVNLLLEKGYQVNLLYRNEGSIDNFRKISRYYEEAHEISAEKINWIKGDILDYDSLSLATQAIDTIIHAAAYVSFKRKDKKRVSLINVKGTENIVNAALQNNVKQVIHVSSIATIGSKKHSDELTEELWPEVYNSIYAKTKTLAEREIWRGFEEGLNGVIVNPSVIIGPGNWKEGSSKIFGSIAKGLPFYTNGVTGYIDVRDVAESIIFLMESDVRKERFILSSENLSYKDLFSKVALALGKKPPKYAVSPGLVNFIRFATANTIVTKEMVNSAFSISKYSAEKFIKLSGKSFRSIDEAVAFTGGCFLK